MGAWLDLKSCTMSGYLVGIVRLDLKSYTMSGYLVGIVSS